MTTENMKHKSKNFSKSESSSVNRNIDITNGLSSVVTTESSIKIIDDNDKKPIIVKDVFSLIENTLNGSFEDDRQNKPQAENRNSNINIADNDNKENGSSFEKALKDNENSTPSSKDISESAKTLTNFTEVMETSNDSLIESKAALANTLNQSDENKETPSTKNIESTQYNVED